MHKGKTLNELFDLVEATMDKMPCRNCGESWSAHAQWGDWCPRLDQNVFRTKFTPMDRYEYVRRAIERQP